MSSVTRRWVLLALAALALAGLALVLVRALGGAPPPTQPEGAYVRVAERLTSGDVERVFALLDDESKASCERLWRARKEARARVESAYPEPDRAKLMERYGAVAAAESAAGVWRVLAEERGWVGALRKDLSGVVKAEPDGDVATIETANGARYPFRRRSDGAWGLALFSDELAESAWRAERDLEVITASAADYERVPAPAASAKP